MEITESALTARYQRADSVWPFIHQAVLARGLPGMLLFAAGSRETNLTNDVGCTSCSGSPVIAVVSAGTPAGFRRDPGPASPVGEGAGVAVVQKKTGADSCQT